VKEIEATGRRAFKAIADVRSLPELQGAVDAGLAELGRIGIVCANAGIGRWAVSWEMTAHQWNEMVDVNLTGVFQHGARRAAVDGRARGRRQPGPYQLHRRPAARTRTPLTTRLRSMASSGS